VKRFLLIGAVGVALLIGGHAALSFGLHPDRLSPVASLAQGCLALIVGTALFVSGMLGLAEAYERVAGDLRELLPVKQAPEAGIELRGTSDLEDTNRGFWRGYQRTAMGICVFLGGMLGLSLTLAGSSLTLYTIAMAAGVAILAGGTLALSIGGMRRMRRCHVAVAHSASTLAAQPDRAAEPRAPAQPRRIPAYSLFRQRGGLGGRAERRRREVQITPS